MITIDDLIRASAQLAGRSKRARLAETSHLVECFVYVACRTRGGCLPERPSMKIRLIALACCFAFACSKSTAPAGAPPTLAQLVTGYTDGIAALYGCEYGLPEPELPAQTAAETASATGWHIATTARCANR